MKKILCPIDFSPTSMNALEYAFELCMKFKSELILFNSIHPSPQGNASLEEIIENEEKVKEKLEEICEAHAKKNHYAGINYWFLVRSGLAGDSVPELIRENQIDMVVMGTKGAEGIKSLFGTLSAEIAAKAPCPVIIIPENYPFRTFQNIVFATDLKGNDTSGLNYIINIAQTFLAHVFLLNIQKKDPDNALKIIADGENLLHLYRYPNMSFHVLEKENITEGINDFAQSHNAELIVMSVSDKSLIEKLLTKSQTREMAMHTKIPFLSMHKEVVFQD